MSCLVGMGEGLGVVVAGGWGSPLKPCTQAGTGMGTTSTGSLSVQVREGGGQWWWLAGNACPLGSLFMGGQWAGTPAWAWLGNRPRLFKGCGVGWENPRHTRPGPNQPGQAWYIRAGTGGKVHI